MVLLGSGVGGAGGGRDEEGAEIVNGEFAMRVMPWVPNARARFAMMVVISTLVEPGEVKKSRNDRAVQQLRPLFPSGRLLSSVYFRTSKNGYLPGKCVAEALHALVSV